MKTFSGAKLATCIAALTVAATAASPAWAAEAHREQFGQSKTGPVEAVVLRNSHGLTARIITWGAALQSMIVPDPMGRLADVVLAYPNMAGYLQKPQYFGATIGRYGNRLAKGTFSLDGHTFHLSTNDGPNSLHGGSRGFDKVIWTISSIRSGPEASVVMSYTSQDGEQGYPGTLRVEVTYSLDEWNRLTIRYSAVTDKPTIVNLTNHSLFNMAGASSGQDVLGQTLTIAAAAYTPVDAGLIPTGELKPVAGGAFDFRTPHLIGDRIREAFDPQLVVGRGYDHNFVIQGGVTAVPKFAARLEDSRSGRSMTILTTEPGLQVYSGNFLDATVVGKDNTIYRQGDGLAMEPQHFPDAPNHPDFPTTRLDPGQRYSQVSVYAFNAPSR